MRACVHMRACAVHVCVCRAGPLFAPQAIARDIFRGILILLLLLLLRCSYAYESTLKAKESRAQRAAVAEESFRGISKESTATADRLAK